MRDFDKARKILRFPVSDSRRGDTIPTADLLPTRSLPTGLIDPVCREVTAHLVRLIRDTYETCQEWRQEPAVRRPGRHGEHPLARWDGGYDRRGRYTTPIWAKIAWATFDRGFDLEDYVQQQFSWHLAVTPSHPNLLLSPTTLEHYGEVWMDCLIRRFHDSRDVMLDGFGWGVTWARPLFSQERLQPVVLKVVRNPNNSFEPFFKHWLAARFDRSSPAFREIRESCRRPALLQYASSVHAYETVYGHPVLADFRAVVARTKDAFAELIADDQAGWVLPPVERTAEARGHVPALAGE
jgi:hypothetical protein